MVSKYLNNKVISILMNEWDYSFTNHRIFNNTITSDVTDDKFNSIVKKTANDSNHNNYNFKKVIIKDLKLYGGPYEVIINVTNSSRPLYLPTSSSYNDYIAMSIPKGFDMIVKFSDSSSTYAQLDIIKKTGDISEYAKEHRIEVPWQKTISSPDSMIISLTILAGIVIVIALTWSKIMKFNRVK